MTADLPPVTLADVLAREADPPHVLTHADAMALALETGWHIEPPVEVAADLCAAQVPIWHAGADWSYCAYPLAESPKVPLLAETWALLGWPVAPLGGFAWPAPWRRGVSDAVGYYGGPGGGWVHGGSWSDDETVIVEGCCGQCVVCPLPPETPEPAPVPLGPTLPMLAGALAMLFTRRRR